MTPLLNRVARVLSVSFNRVNSRIPVLRQWPGLAKIVTEGYRQFLAPFWVFPLAMRHRKRLPNTTFIAVTGSVGKTTAKEMIAAVLAGAGPCEKSRGNDNEYHHLGRTVLHTRAEHRFCVLELSAPRPGYLDRVVRLVRPDIAVVTAIGTDHRAAYGARGQEAIAQEKGKIVESLPSNGTAVLNADDALVMAMRLRCDAHIITYGLSREAQMRAEEIRSEWPDRLQFRVRYQGQSHEVRTRLCGAHWLGSVLAGLCAGVAAGVPLAQAVRAVSAVEPPLGRMSPVFHEDGVTFIRDDWKSPYPSLSPAFDFLKSARAKRKIIIVGTISDYAGSSRKRYSDVARLGREVADHVVFVGARGTTALRVKRGADDTSIRAFASVRHASEQLRDFFRDGDLVLLKGSTKADHLHRIVLARTRRVACWRADCGLSRSCDTCERLGIPSGSPAVRTELESEAGDSRDDERGRAAKSSGERPAQVVVGMGNPGEAYLNTPHSVGYQVLDCLARSRGLQWRREEDAVVSWTQWKGQQVVFLKPLVAVNETGPALERLSRRMGFSHAQCILVHDDLDLPLGKVKARLRGGDGGHRGVRSVLLTFETDEIRRVKVGVGRDEAPSTTRTVLTPFTAQALPMVEDACRTAAERVMDLLEPQPSGNRRVS